MQIKNLTLARNSNFHTLCLERTVETQTNEIRRLKRTLVNKSQQLLKCHRLTHQLQIQIEKAEQYEQQLKTRIRELTCLESDTEPSPKLDSHNSSLPPSLDPPWNKPKITNSFVMKKNLPLKLFVYFHNSFLFGLQLKCICSTTINS